MAIPNSPKAYVFIGLIVAGLGGGVWGWAHYSGADEAQSGPQIPEDYSIDKIKAAAKEDPGAAFEKMRELRDRTDLSDEQREKIGSNMRQVMEEEMDARLNEYFAAKPEDQEAILDRHIDEMEKFRKAMEERRAKEEEERKAQSEEDEKVREQRREEWRKRMGDRTQAQRKADSEGRDPNKMAQRMAYFSAMQKRMAARGIQGPRWGRWGGGRGGPGGGPRRGPGG